MISFKEFLLLEYISNPLIWFRDFVNSTSTDKAKYIADEVLYRDTDIYKTYCEEFDIPYSEDELDDGYEFIESLTESELIRFGNWLLTEEAWLEDIIDISELPSWYFMEDATIVKNTWLVHETNSVSDIMNEGFQYGIEDYTKLGLTTHFSHTAKKRSKSEDFYLFAYTPEDFIRYGKNGRRGLKYGDEFIVFRSSGVRIDHNTDDEYQTIFSARQARDFVAVYTKDGMYNVEDKNSDKIIYQNQHPEMVVEWIINNYNQYKNKIFTRAKN